MSVVNLLLGALMVNDGRDVTSAIQKRFKTEVVSAGIEVGVFDLATTKDAVTESIKSNKYDVVICQEWLSGESIGGGTISQWLDINPRIKIILIVDSEKKHGKKLENLYRKHQYYDAIYNADMTGETIASLINESRTRDAALEYYGLKKFEEDEEEGEEKVVKSVVDISELPIDVPTEDELDDKEFEEAMRNMGHLFPDNTESVSEQEMSADEEDEDVFAGVKVFEDAGVDESGDKEAEELLRGFEQLQQKQVDAVAPNDACKFMIVPVARAIRTSALPTKGIVLNVMDHNLLMIGFDGKPIFIPGEDVSDYRITILIEKEKKGHVSSGKYETGLITIVGYGNCMVDTYTAVIEVPDYDMLSIKEQIRGRNCNLVLVKHLNSDTEVSA